MALTRWEPMRDIASLRDVMDRLFDERLFRPYRWSDGLNLGIALDVYEEADKYVVEAVLPGLKAEDVDVSVQGNTLTISGELPAFGGEGRNYLLRERASGKFTRTLTLPVEIEADKVEAAFHDGILDLTLPKAPQYKPKKNVIKAGN